MRSWGLLAANNRKLLHSDTSVIKIIFWYCCVLCRTVLCTTHRWYSVHRIHWYTCSTLRCTALHWHIAYTCMPTAITAWACRQRRYNGGTVLFCFLSFKWTSNSMATFHDKHIHIYWYLETIAKSCLLSPILCINHCQGLIFYGTLKSVFDMFSDQERPKSMKNFFLSTMNFVMEGQYS